MSVVIRPSRLLHYNAGAFVSQGEACVVDPGILPDEIEALARGLGDSELRCVVLTHADWDHVLGPEHLPSTAIVAHSAYSDDLDRDGVRVMVGKLEERRGTLRKAPFEPPLPTLTFDEQTTLTLGGLALRLEHAPGHAASMLTIYEPQDATLWAADILSDVEIPSIVHDLESYERTLARIAELEIRVLVPGHGTPATDAAEIERRLMEDRRYLEELHTTVAGAVTASKSLDETVALCQAITLRRSEDDDDVHRLNVEKAYADLGGAAEPDAVGFARAWKEATTR